MSAKGAESPFHLAWQQRHRPNNHCPDRVQSRQRHPTPNTGLRKSLKCWRYGTVNPFIARKLGESSTKGDPQPLETLLLTQASSCVQVKHHPDSIKTAPMRNCKATPHGND
ncbi:hypothetical protein MJO29_016309 [Puccinia striiformis f. sp. tritici]|nr:hypothetical protein MJO29_016309 [Puccinia striiformis f. sp. tritici]